MKTRAILTAFLAVCVAFSLAIAGEKGEKPAKKSSTKKVMSCCEGKDMKSCSDEEKKACDTEASKSSIKSEKKTEVKKEDKSKKD